MKIKDGAAAVFFCSVFINVTIVSFVFFKTFIPFGSRGLEQNTTNSLYWQDKVAFFEALNRQQKGGAFLVGDSMFDRLHIESVFSDRYVRNRGIGYDNSRSLLQRLDRSVFSGMPGKIILFIGANDVSQRDDVTEVIADVERIISAIMSRKIELIVVSLLPRGRNYVSEKRTVTTINDDILLFNRIMNEKCVQRGIVFVDITKYFVNENSLLGQKFTSDGIHLNGQGMLLLAELLSPYLVSVQK